MDKTGPQGKGPRTGRGLGKCGDSTPKQPARPRWGRQDPGMGQGQRRDPGPQNQ